MAKNARQLQNAIRDFLVLKGFFVWAGGAAALKLGNRFARFGSVGAPDLFALRVEEVHDEFGMCRMPRVYGIEVKYGRDRVSPDQAAFHEAFQRHGGIVIVARSVLDVEKVIQ